MRAAYNNSKLFSDSKLFQIYQTDHNIILDSKLYVVKKTEATIRYDWIEACGKSLLPILGLTN